MMLATQPHMISRYRGLGAVLFKCSKEFACGFETHRNASLTPVVPHEREADPTSTFVHRRDVQAIYPFFGRVQAVELVQFRHGEPSFLFCRNSQSGLIRRGGPCNAKQEMEGEAA